MVTPSTPIEQNWTPERDTMQLEAYPLSLSSKIPRLGSLTGGGYRGILCPILRQPQPGSGNWKYDWHGQR